MDDQYASSVGRPVTSEKTVSKGWMKRNMRARETSKKRGMPASSPSIPHFTLNMLSKKSPFELF
jgi:hypothetical protein